jgi:hypothetical protein
MLNPSQDGGGSVCKYELFENVMVAQTSGTVALVVRQNAHGCPDDQNCTGIPHAVTFTIFLRDVTIPPTN